MIEKKYDIGYLGSGPMGFEEVSGVAGEDLAENDVVGYFNKPNNIEVVTNIDSDSAKIYFDNGNKYVYPYSSNSYGTMLVPDTGGYFYIYDTHTNEIIETRYSSIGSIAIFDTIESPDLDFVYTYEYTPTLKTHIYMYNGSDYEFKTTIATGFKVRLGIKHRFTTRDYVVFLMMGASSTDIYNGPKTVYLRVYSMNKSTYSVNVTELSASAGDSSYSTSAGYDYNNYINVIYCVSPESTPTYYTGYAVYMDLSENNPLQVISNKSKYTSSQRLLYCKDRFKYIYIYYNYVSSSSNITYVWVRNGNGTEYTYKPTSNKTMYLCSASEDFNEVIIYNDTDKVFYLLNVENQTCEELTDNLPNYYISNKHSGNVDVGSRMIIKDLNDTVNPNKLAYIKNFNSSFNKIDHCGQGLFEYVGIVKNTCKQGENVTVYKIIDF